MKKNIFLILSCCIIFLLALPNFVVSQPNKQPQTIALFAPLYLDSAFDASGNYRYDKQFPKFLNPGLEFYEGAQIAFDSLNKLNFPLNVLVYDTKANILKPQAAINSSSFKNVKLIIGYVNADENFLLAGMAKERKIPYVNVNLPNNSNTYDNPFYVQINANLKTQCENIFRLLQNKYEGYKIIYFKKVGNVEDMIYNIFNDCSATFRGKTIHFQLVHYKEDLSKQSLLKYIDTTRNNVCVVGTMDNFASQKILEVLAQFNSTNSIHVIGMPTWETNMDFHKPEYKKLSIIYGTSFNPLRTDNSYNVISNNFKTFYFARPSDVVIRGFDIVWNFSQLLNQYPNDLVSNLSNKKFLTNCGYDIQPVSANTSKLAFDYLENVKVHFVKWNEGNRSLLQ